MKWPEVLELLYVCVAVGMHKHMTYPLFENDTYLQGWLTDLEEQLCTYHHEPFKSVSGPSNPHPWTRRQTRRLQILLPTHSILHVTSDKQHRERRASLQSQCIYPFFPCPCPKPASQQRHMMYIPPVTFLTQMHSS